MEKERIELSLPFFKVRVIFTLSDCCLALHLDHQTRAAGNGGDPTTLVKQTVSNRYTVVPQRMCLYIFPWILVCTGKSLASTFRRGEPLL
ncbi:hypothetical protein OUZ56_013345 [Daphnia magna]|uniref:Uncharacterized protein n=1 Tax=Daphnia magna TaxID=35525 RepID=A0ABQ9Z5L5_9CRUS|nr:hypothetical protein OUZ56_013345 [Daphnia magna]